MIASDPLDRTLVNITGLLLEKTPKIVTVNVYRVFLASQRCHDLSIQPKHIENKKQALHGHSSCPSFKAQTIKGVIKSI
jgi:hypothetical protein